MAITGVKEKMSLKLELDGGIVNGKQKVDSKTFGKVKTTAVDDDLYGVATALGDLQSKDVLKIKRIEETALLSE